MADLGLAVASAARGLVGVRFRPQGRDPAIGLDCVGVAAAALTRAGVPVAPPGDYPQRGGEPIHIASLIDGAGLERIDPATAVPGDLLLLCPGPAQFHVAILIDGGFVHADAGLRRVVATPGSPGWPVLGAWRATEGKN